MKIKQSCAQSEIKINKSGCLCLNVSASASASSIATFVLNTR